MQKLNILVGMFWSSYQQMYDQEIQGLPCLVLHSVDDDSWFEHVKKDWIDFPKLYELLQVK